ncbi:MAG TPA: DUF3368 domain-containing protein [Cytophagales bacterium]|nr:DUF3368 domain-containing protein [Cytophagales bacterium]
MILIADTSPLISLIHLDKLELLDQLFQEYYLPEAVWEELSNHQELAKFKKSLKTLSSKRKQLNSKYLLLTSIDKGEAEAILLFKELKADFLLIDDKKARMIAEMESIICIGTLGVLYLAWKKGLLKNLKPSFSHLISQKRYYSIEIFNYFLDKTGEELF